MKIHAVFFDLDGTLIDTTDDIVSATNYALEKMGLPARPIEELRKARCYGMNKFAEKALPPENQNFKHNLLQLIKKCCLETGLSKSYICPGINDLLCELGNKGIMLVLQRYKRFQ